MIQESGVAEFRHPREIVILRVIYAARAAESPFGDRNAEMVVEGREVRAATGITHRRLERVRHRVRATPLFVHAAAAIRIRHGTRDVPYRGAQRGRATPAEAGSLRRDVLIEVRDGILR